LCTKLSVSRRGIKRRRRKRWRRRRSMNRRDFTGVSSILRTLPTLLHKYGMVPSPGLR
jgi:hypothetical protein